jgi:hypothetical protein
MCKLIRVLYAVVRSDRFRDYLIRKHMAVCPRCRQDEAAVLEGGLSLRPPEWIFREASLWPEVERMMAGRGAPGPARPQVPRRRPFAELAVASGGVLAVAVLTLLLGRRPPVTDDIAAVVARAPRIEILSAAIEGRPARATLYQTERASFIWFSETSR